MSASGSEKAKKKSASSPKKKDQAEERKSEAKEAPGVDESLEPFLEGNHETRMTFDDGGFPLYVKAVWAVFLVSITYYIYVYALPDLTAWGSP